jgi:hypothetical protein
MVAVFVPPLPPLMVPVETTVALSLLDLATLVLSLDEEPLPVDEAVEVLSAVAVWPVSAFATA